jgi:hypothetical protein
MNLRDWIKHDWKQRTSRERKFLVAGLIGLIIYAICALVGEVHFELLPAVAGSVMVLWFLVYAKFMGKVRRYISKRFPPNRHPDENPPSP